MRFALSIKNARPSVTIIVVMFQPGFQRSGRITNRSSAMPKHEEGRDQDEKGHRIAQLQIPDRQNPREISAHGIDRAIGEIEDPGDAVDQGQAKCQQRIDGAQHDPADQDFDDLMHSPAIHSLEPETPDPPTDETGSPWRPRF